MVSKPKTGTTKRPGASGKKKTAASAETAKAKTAFQERDANIRAETSAEPSKKRTLDTFLEHCTGPISAQLNVTAKDDEDEDEDEDEEFDISKYDCNEIRRKIRAFLASGEMKITHWQNELDINSNSYGRFMKLKGPWSGQDNQTFEAATRFFQRREKAGIKTRRPKKKAKTADNDTDLSAITLEGEENDSVEIYDSCDEVRRKINAKIREGETQAALCRAFENSFQDKPKIQGVQLSRFLKLKGATSGSISAVYYGAYVYFEKLRIKEGKKKSKHREEMESIWRNGAPRINPALRRVWIGPGGGVPVEDAYGRVSIVK